MTTRDLLIEIGVEELPSSFLAHALGAMKTAADELFAASRLAPESIRVMGTPRRMVLVVSGLPEQQPDRSETVTGPPWAAAFEDDGTPKKAATGFAKKK